MHAMRTFLHPVFIEAIRLYHCSSAILSFAVVLRNANISAEHFDYLGILSATLAAECVGSLGRIRNPELDNHAVFAFLPSDQISFWQDAGLSNREFGIFRAAEVRAAE